MIIRNKKRRKQKHKSYKRLWDEMERESETIERKKFNFRKLKKDYAEFLKSEYWKRVRAKVLHRDGNKCTVCGSEKKLEVHHTTYKNHFKEMDHLEDLVTLCHTHHKETHFVKFCKT